MMGKADLHIHTTYSYDGTATVAATLEYVVRNTDLDVIAITDHDQIDGALEAVELAPQYGVHVIPGVEISTAEGHVLALYIKKLVPAGLSLNETLAAVAEQNGLCIAAHPGGPWQWALKKQAIQQALANPQNRAILVGVETYNASLPTLYLNRRAAQIAAELGQQTPLAAVGNSDAHMLWTIGLASTKFAGNDPISLRKALYNRTTRVAMQKRPAHFIVSYLKHQLLRTCGLAQCSPIVPGGPITLRRLSALS